MRNPEEQRLGSTDPRATSTSTLSFTSSAVSNRPCHTKLVSPSASLRYHCGPIVFVFECFARNKIPQHKASGARRSLGLCSDMVRRNAMLPGCRWRALLLRHPGLPFLRGFHNSVSSTCYNLFDWAHWERGFVIIHSGPDGQRILQLFVSIAIIVCASST
jgi:hypothetical protein